MNLEGTVRYVMGVLRSCKNKSQFDEALPWGVTAIAKSATRTKQPKVDHRGKRIEKITAPRITSCKQCGGQGVIDGVICDQCEGSGRVVIISEIATYIKPFTPRV